MKERKSAGNGQDRIEGGVHVESIRKAAPGDASRLAEILIFAKRTAYRPIFRNDAVSFGEMQVLPLALDYLEGRKSLSHIWVYDGGFVKGMVRVDSGEIHELYVDPFFQNEGIGGLLLDFAVRRQGGRTGGGLRSLRRRPGHQLQPGPAAGPPTAPPGRRASHDAVA